MSAQRAAVLVLIVLCGAAMATGQTVWEHDPGNPILGPGDPGSWDEGGRAALTVLFDGSLYHMWFAGVDGAGIAREVGHATSLDGLPPWTVDPDPVLTRGAPGEWDDEFLFGAAVGYDGMQFHMWYSASDGSVQQVGYAWSDNGTVWHKDYDHNPVLEVGDPGTWDDWIVRVGTVILDVSTYKMWYMAGAAPGFLRIGYAESADGLVWNKHPDAVLDMNFSVGAWDRAVGNPWVVLEGSTYHMWYAGLHANPPEQYRIGYAYSVDGKHWTKHSDNPVIETADEFAVLAPVIFDGSTFHMWYSHGRPPGISVSYATSTCCAGLFGDDFETGDTSLWSATVP